MFTLPELKFPVAALEPHIDAKTMEIHHGKHHAAYVNNLNAALEKIGEEWRKLSLLDLNKKINEVPESVRTAVRNNGGGHWNHAFFWDLLSPKGGGAPQGSLAAAVEATFGSLDDFKAKFEAAGLGRFGSGWAWLVVKDGKLAITSTPNQDNPWMDNSGTPILGVDVWEHAYYLNYQNRRPDYIKAFWSVVNWSYVEQQYEKAR